MGRTVFVPISMSKVIFGPCSVMVRNDMVVTARFETARYVVKWYGRCGTLRNGAGGTVLLMFDTVRCDIVWR